MKLQRNDNTAMPIVLRCESVAALPVVILLYTRMGGSWLMFALLCLVPDLSMLGYLGGPRVGAVCYNIAHSLAIPALLLAAGLSQSSDLASQIALIWLAHIFMDRALGFGLKHQTGFTHTHLGTLASPLSRQNSTNVATNHPVTDAS